VCGLRVSISAAGICNKEQIYDKCAAQLHEIEKRSMRAASPLDLRRSTLFEKLPQLLDRLSRVFFGEEMPTSE
jgi:hypothetical protein